MKNLTLENIAEKCCGRYFGEEADRETEVQGIVIDSRQVQKGYLFIAIRGERVDGHTYIPAVFREGAAAVISEEELKQPGGPYILVDSCKRALQEIAEFYRMTLAIPIIGITGSVGKTSTKEMVASVLSQKYQVHKTAGNFNNEIGLPLTLFGIREKHDVAVVEMGISDFGEMHRLGTMAKPDICLITNIGLCHLENLKSRDGILKAKTEVFDHMKPDGAVILNMDDDKLASIGEVNGKRPIFYGQSRGDAYAAELEDLGLKGTRIKLHLFRQEEEVTIPIPGEHNVYNALAAACAGHILGLTMQEIKAGIENTKTIGGRSNFIELSEITVIDDCYNANPVSMRSSIDVLSYAKGRKIAVLGDMGELGERERQLHYGVGEYLAKKPVDQLFCAGNLSKEILRAVKEASGTCVCFGFETREEMIQCLLENIKPGDTVLIKASHFMQFEKVTEAIKKQYGK